MVSYTFGLSETRGVLCTTYLPGFRIIFTDGMSETTKVFLTSYLPVLWIPITFGLSETSAFTLDIYLYCRYSLFVCLKQKDFPALDIY